MPAVAEEEPPLGGVVHRYDVASWVPSGLPPVARFRHGGASAYFDGWYRGHELAAADSIYLAIFNLSLAGY